VRGGGTGQCVVRVVLIERYDTRFRFSGRQTSRYFPRRSELSFHTETPLSPLDATAATKQRSRGASIVHAMPCHGRAKHKTQVSQAMDAGTTSTYCYTLSAKEIRHTTDSPCPYACLAFIAIYQQLATWSRSQPHTLTPSPPSRA
jgi:hypothetical protein